MAPITDTNSAIRAIHIVSAAILFLTLAYMSHCRFTRSGPEPTEEKKIRNKVYRICAYAMYSGLGLLLVRYCVLRAGLVPESWNDAPAVLIIEALMLIAFGFSWLVKGDTLWRDHIGRSSLYRMNGGK